MTTANALLSALPPNFRDPLLNSYREIELNYLEHRWEPAELNGGKFCEAVYSILSAYILGSYPAAPSKPANMQVACRALEASPANSSRIGDRSVRVLIPRALPVLYEIRNNRGVGHIGGDVDPNFMDATAVQGMAGWILAELVRIFHQISVKKAQQLVDALVERKHPLIWEIEGNRRVLDPKMSKPNQTLLLLYQQSAWVPEADLLQWIEASSPSIFRRDVLARFHKQRLIEYDKQNARVRISPLGATKVEQAILKSRT